MGSRSSFPAPPTRCGARWRCSKRRVEQRSAFRHSPMVARIDVLRDAARLSLSSPGLSFRSHACPRVLPQGGADFPGRWRAIKTAFAKSLPIGEPRSPVMTSRGEHGIWQRRYWEHRIRDDPDFAARMNYTHFSPVQSSTVLWCTRQNGRIRRFICAVTSGCILPGGGAAAMNRKRPANGSDAKRWNQAENTTSPPSPACAPATGSRRNALRCSALRLLIFDRYRATRSDRFSIVHSSYS
jgi:hypothetical protein